MNSVLFLCLLCQKVKWIWMTLVWTAEGTGREEENWETVEKKLQKPFPACKRNVLVEVTKIIYKIEHCKNVLLSML